MVYSTHKNGDFVDGFNFCSNHIKCVTWDLTSGNYLQVSGELFQELTGPGRVFVRARVDGLLWDQHGQVEGVVLEKDQLRVKAPWVAARRHFWSEM